MMRLRNAAFDAMYKLWRRREAEGMTQQTLAEILNRDRAWVSRVLRGPANWEFKTFARLVRALNGEAEIAVYPMEERVIGQNFDAYRVGGNLLSSVTCRSSPQAGNATLLNAGPQTEVFVTRMAA